MNINSTANKQRKIQQSNQQIQQQEFEDIFNKSFTPIYETIYSESKTDIFLKIDRMEFFKHMSERLNYTALSVKRSLRHPSDFLDTKWKKLYKLIKSECLQIKNWLDASDFKSINSIKLTKGSKFIQDDINKDLINLIPEHAILQNPLKIKNDLNNGFRSIALLLKSPFGEEFHEELKVRTILEMVIHDKHFNGFKKHTELISRKCEQIISTEVYPEYFQKETLEMLNRFEYLNSNSPDYPIQMWQIEALHTCINTLNIGVPQFFILSKLLKARIHIAYPDAKNPYFKAPIPQYYSSKTDNTS
ncbi:4885_t:CDS:2 [Diversispora eburnea]|uniref:4885_t:CDS:1 n=1 Tax=Diversispora eburnea TaxID=1213867 RepID=A0A9N9BKP0_9GLOM|nr:4885_t:CDS:2 [Diversispora eburnea]